MEKKRRGNEGPPLLHKILLWLPVVHLLRCKAVCKSWRDLIQSSFFIDLHTATTLNSSSSSYSKFGSFILHAVGDSAENALIMLSSASGSEDSVSGSGGYYCREDEDEDDDDDQLVVKLDNLGFPSCYKVFMGPRITIVGSCNGLVCQQAGNNYFLWNPATGQFRILPEPITTTFYRFSNMGMFGFDVETKDYKVLLLSPPEPRPNGHGPVDCFFQVQVYSLSTDSWRLLEGIPCLPGNPLMKSGCISDFSGLYLNGSCFFLAHFFYTEKEPCLPENDRFIISFDFTKEIITPIQLPDHHRNQELCLCYFGDKIALFTAPRFPVSTDSRIGVFDYRIGSYEDFNIWVLNEHGTSSGSVNKESWEKLHSFQIEIKAPYESYIPRGISNDGKFVLLETRFPIGLGNGLGKNMNLYNLVTKEVKSLLSDFLVTSKVHAYKPSLVSIIGGNGAAAAADRVIGNNVVQRNCMWNCRRMIGNDPPNFRQPNFSFKHMWNRRSVIGNDLRARLNLYYRQEWSSSS